MQIFSTKEWEKTFELAKNAAVNIAIYSKKGEHLFGEQNVPFKDVTAPDTDLGYIFMPVQIDAINCVLVCKPIISIDKTVKIIQKAIELLNLTTEKKEQHEQLAIKCAYLQTINPAKNVERLVQATMEFLVHKLKLANCSIKLNGINYRYFETKTSHIYAEVENIIHKQTSNSRVPSRISSLQEDFMLKSIDRIEELPKAMLSLPLVKEGKYLGTIFCYLEEILNKKINQAEIVAQELTNNINLLTELQEAQTNARTDSLTGLLNRSLLFPYLDELITTNSEKETSTSLLIFDIDDFKKYNDTHGHLAGDEILRKLAGQIKRLPKDSVTFRYGGEEFVTILNSIDSNQTKEIAEELRKNIEENCDLTVSVGCINCKNSSVSSKMLLEEADKALYRAKSLGKNKVVQFIIIDKSLGVVDTTQA